MVAYGGWSAGDIALAIKFLYRVGKTLKDSGDSAEEYQQATAFLNSLEQTLRNLVQLEAIPGQESTRAVIESEAKRVADRLQIFIIELENFETSLGANRKRKFYHGVRRKIEWAGFTSDKVQELQLDLALPVAAINTNINILTMHAVQILRKEVPLSTQKDIFSHLGRVSSTIDSRLKIMSSEVQAQTKKYDEVLKYLEGVDASQKNLQLQLQDVSSQSSCSLEISDGTNNTLPLDATNAKGIITTRQLGFAASLDIESSDCSGAATLVAMSLRDFTLAITQLLTELIKTMWLHLIIFARTLHLALPYISSIPRGYSAVLGIKFSRAEFRTMHACLSGYRFRYSDIIQPNLHPSHTDSPVRNLTALHSYKILNAKSKRVIQSHKWTMSITPGTRIYGEKLLKPSNRLHKASDITTPPLLGELGAEIVSKIRRSLGAIVTRTELTHVYQGEPRRLTHVHVVYLIADMCCVQYDTEKPPDLGLLSFAELPMGICKQLQPSEAGTSKNHYGARYSIYAPKATLEGLDQPCAVRHYDPKTLWSHIG